MSRLFLLIDELENVPTGLYPDLENQMSNLADENDKGFKVVAAFNPKDPSLEPGRMAEPEGGWKGFNAETDEQWLSKKGWNVIRLDAEKSENVLEERVIYPGLQSFSALKALESKSGGRNSPGYWTFGRGCYPPQGVDLGVIPQSVLDTAVAELVFSSRPTSVGGADLALDGGDHAKLCHGLYGMAVGIKVAGKLVKFSRPRNCLQINGIFTLPKGDTVQMANEVKALAAALGIKPEMLAVDKTGHTRGVFDVLKNTWGPLLGVNYSESPTGKQIEEDGPKSDEEFDRVLSELHFAVRYWFERDCCFFLPEFDRSEVVMQLSGRRYDPRRRNKVEEKKEFKLRNRGHSPDDADALTLAIHVVRCVLDAKLPPAGKPNSSQQNQKSVEEDGEEAYIDITNRFDSGDF
jgi:hypothetical protein